MQELKIVRVLSIITNRKRKVVIIGDKICFKGLKTEEFVHPKEIEAKKTLLGSPGYQKMVSMLSKVADSYSFTQREGQYTQLFRETAPYLFGVLENTCKILDIQEIPDLYMMHSYSQIVLPCGTEKPYYLVISDYISEMADEDMLYYLFGNAMAMIKAGHVEITNLTSYMTSNIWLMAPQLAIKSYLHIADSTSDRGGLLACQSFRSAVRCHLLELGVPMRESEKLFRNDDEAASYVAEYLKEVYKLNEQDSLLTKVSSAWMDATYIEGAANTMLYELYQWYKSGYGKLLKKYAARGHWIKEVRCE